MQQGAKPWLAAAISMLAGACTAGNIGTDYVSIDAEDSGLLFYGPGLAGGHRHIVTGTDDTFVRRTVANYGPSTGSFPLARIYYAETPPGRQFKHDVAARATIKRWGLFRNRAIETGAAGTTFNAMGRIGYATARADGVACVVWRQTMGIRENGGVGTRLISGYYCRGEGPMMSASEAESIVRLIGHRSYGPIEPPDGWSDNGTLPIAVMWMNRSSGLDHFRGIIEVPRDGRDGTIHIGPRGGRKCSGPLIPEEAHEGRTVMKWSLTCSDGLTAKGSLRYRHRDEYVIGEGEDSEGRDLALID